MNLRVKSGLFNSKRSLYYSARVNFQMKDVPGSRMWIWKPSLLALSFAGDGLTLALLAPCACLLSCVRLFATPWTAAHQVPLSMEFSRQEYWSGLPFPPPGDLLTQGLNLHLPSLVHWYRWILYHSGMWEIPPQTVLIANNHFTRRIAETHWVMQ